jgi:hypothetical protein
VDDEVDEAVAFDEDEIDAVDAFVPPAPPLFSSKITLPPQAAAMATNGPRPSQQRHRVIVTNHRAPSSLLPVRHPLSTSKLSMSSATRAEISHGLVLQRPRGSPRREVNKSRGEHDMKNRIGDDAAELRDDAVRIGPYFDRKEPYLQNGIAH